MRYVSLGDVPAKRHAQTRRNGTLLTEEVLGYEGFSGNESILYHLHSPCRLSEVGEFRPIVREEWVPDAHVHRLADANPVDSGGDAITGRRLLMFNNDIEASICKPTEAHEGFYRNGEGDEVIYVHRGGGVLHTMFGTRAVPREGLRRHPARDHAPLALDEDVEQFWVCFHTPGEIETPNRYRNRYGQLLEHAPYSSATSTARPSLETIEADGEFELTLRVRDGYQSYVLDRHPFDVVGLGRLRLPVHVQRDGLRAARRALPPAPAGPPDLPGPELRHLHVRAADARLGRDGGADPLPPLEHPVRGGHVLRRRRLRRAQGRGDRLPDPAPLGPPPRPAARARSRRRSAPSRPASSPSCGTPSAR
jgi:homogentisate 1,2-dioxygenase